MQHNNKAEFGKMSKHVRKSARSTRPNLTDHVGEQPRYRHEARLIPKAHGHTIKEHAWHTGLGRTQRGQRAGRVCMRCTMGKAEGEGPRERGIMWIGRWGEVPRPIISTWTNFDFVFLLFLKVRLGARLMLTGVGVGFW